MAEVMQSDTTALHQMPFGLMVERKVPIHHRRAVAPHRMNTTGVKLRRTGLDVLTDHTLTPCGGRQ